MTQELVLVLLCVVAIVVLLWNITLQLRLKEIARKIKTLEETKKE